MSEEKKHSGIGQHVLLTRDELKKKEMPDMAFLEFKAYLTCSALHQCPDFPVDDKETTQQTLEKLREILNATMFGQIKELFELVDRDISLHYSHRGVGMPDALKKNMMQIYELMDIGPIPAKNITTQT